MVRDELRRNGDGLVVDEECAALAKTFRPNAFARRLLFMLFVRFSRVLRRERRGDCGSQSRRRLVVVEEVVVHVHVVVLRRAANGSVRHAAVSWSHVSVHDATVRVRVRVRVRVVVRCCCQEPT